MIVEKEAGRSNRIIKKGDQDLSIHIVLSMPEEQLSSFNIHYHTNIHLQHHFKCREENLEDGEIIRKGFNESYSLKQQNKICLLTGVTNRYHRKNG